MTCEHSWTSGTPVWRKKKPLIKTKCELCEKTIYIEFGNKIKVEKQALDDIEKEYRKQKWRRRDK